MKILTASLAALLATISGQAVTETSTEAEVKAALDGVTAKVAALDKDKVDLTARADAAEKQVTALQGEKTQLTTDLTAAQGEVTKLQGESKTTDQKAQEIAAAHGSPAAKKDTDVAAGTQPDGKAIYDEYAKLNGREAAEFWDKHGKTLTAYGEAEARRARRND